MELANKFNKAESDKRGTSGGSTILSGPSECIICQGTQTGKAADLSEGDKGPILPLGSDHAVGLRREGEEEEDDDESIGKSGALRGRKLFSSFLSLGEDAK